MARPPVSVTIITLNEEVNLPHAIESVKWANEILVVDSGSTDRTVEIARKMGAKVLHNPWPGYGQQKNFAQKSAKNGWILNIDADEVVPSDLASEIADALQSADSGRSQAKGFYFPRKTYYLGRWIRKGGWYPNYLVRLAHRDFANWTEPSVHEELKVNGAVEGLKHPLTHYSFSSIQEQILTNLRFSQLGSMELKKSGKKASILKLVLKPFGKFVETYFIKRGFMDGLPGFIISVNAAYSMFLKYAYLIESQLRPKKSGLNE